MPATNPTFDTVALKICLRRALAVILFLVASSSAALASDPTVLKGRMVTEIDALGDATTQVTFQTNSQLYTMLKASTPNTAVLVKQLGMTSGWGEIEELEGKFHDGTSSIEITYRQRGLCREVAAGRWIMPHSQWHAGQVVASYGREIVINQIMPSALGFASMVAIVRCPEGTTDVKLQDDRNELSFSFAPAVEANDSPAAIDLTVDTKQTLMSSLAKCYSNSAFGHLWAARSVMRNTGESPMDDFRIRFRVAELSSWGSWNRVHRVYPGQTVVDSFFPVFDLQKVAAMTNSRSVMVEVEYSYRTVDGERVNETDSYPLQLMARNEAVFSNLPPEECLSFEDHFENIGPLLASMTTPSDPVVQQLAGRIHGLATARLGQGISAASSNQDAIEYLRSIHQFMKGSGIAYQTPPSLLVDGQAGQHIKYSRDVLSNRAGTCVDLTVLWLSLVQAAGLEPIAVVIPGHAFPAVRLPSGDVVAIESTLLSGSFDEAIEIGMRNLEKAGESDSIMVDVAELHGNGVTPLDLPHLPVDFLDQMKYRFDQEVEAPQADVDPPSVDREPQEDSTGMAADWSFSGMDGEVFAVVVLRLQENGNCAVHIELTTDAKGRTNWAGEGTWNHTGDTLVMQIDDETIRWPFQLVDGGLRVRITEIDRVFDLERLELN